MLSLSLTPTHFKLFFDPLRHIGDWVSLKLALPIVLSFLILCCHLSSCQGTPPINLTRNIWGCMGAGCVLGKWLITENFPWSPVVFLRFSYEWEMDATIENSYDYVAWTCLVFYLKSQIISNATRKCYFLSSAHSCLTLSVEVFLRGLLSSHLGSTNNFYQLGAIW